MKYPSLRAANGRPARFDLGEDALAEVVARASESERNMRVQALQAACSGTRTSHAEIELRANPSLLRFGVAEARGELGVLGRSVGPAFDAACSLEPRHRRDEVGTCQPERRRERTARIVVGRLLRHGGTAVGAADDDAPERARGAA
jgi:hypothetical protein